MTEQNRLRILSEYSHFTDELCEALGLGPYSHEKAIDLLRTHGQKTVFELLLAFIKNVMPVTIADTQLAPEHFPQVLNMFETREMAEAFLSEIPDDGAEKLERILKELRSLLPRLKRSLKNIAKQLPPNPSGRHKKLDSLEGLSRIRHTMASLIEHGCPPHLLIPRAARRLRVSESTVRRRLRESQASFDDSNIE